MLLGVGRCSFLLDFWVAVLGVVWCSKQKHVRAAAISCCWCGRHICKRKHEVSTATSDEENSLQLSKFCEVFSLVGFSHRCFVLCYAALCCVARRSW